MKVEVTGHTDTKRWILDTETGEVKEWPVDDASRMRKTIIRWQWGGRGVCPECCATEERGRHHPGCSIGDVAEE